MIMAFLAGLGGLGLVIYLVCATGQAALGQYRGPSAEEQAAIADYQRRYPGTTPYEAKQGLAEEWIARSKQ